MGAKNLSDDELDAQPWSRGVGITEMDKRKIGLCHRRYISGRSVGRRACVNVGGDWIATDKVEFLGIEEGMRGEDILTFSYKGAEYKRTVHLR